MATPHFFRFSENHPVTAMPLWQGKKVDEEGDRFEGETSTLGNSIGIDGIGGVKVGKKEEIGSLT